jgi:hypothetical protein
MNFCDLDSKASYNLPDGAVWKGGTNIRLQGLRSSTGVACRKLDFLLCFLRTAGSVVTSFCVKW